LASEKLIHHLGSQGLNWTPTTPLKDYYDQFTVLCPAIADMYDIFFASVPLTITFLEQGFTIVHTIAHPNMATLTTSNSIKHRKYIVSDISEQIKMDRENNGGKKIGYDSDCQKSEQDGVDYDAEKVVDTDKCNKKKRYREFRDVETRYKYVQYVYENTKKEIEDIQESSDVVVTRRSLSNKKQ